MPHFNTPPLSLYIHIPWCVRKCPYCDFNSHQVTERLDEKAYINALLADLEHDLPLVAGREISSVFIGGGTPSLFSAEAVGLLLNGIRSRTPCQSGMEVTLEANPGTLESGRYAGYRDAGVNRLSIGVQSFSADALTRLGRIHGPDEVVRAVASARSAGFDNFNIDLMFGLPGATPEQALDDMQSAISLRPSHISYYQLTLEPNTLFHHHPPPLPPEDDLWQIQSQGHAALAAAGYGQYEVSAFALPGRQCRHNLNYWRFGDYIGIGAGAHGKLTRESGQVERRWRLRSPEDYLAHAESPGVVAGSRVLDEQDLMLEFLMNALRLTEGFSSALFSDRTGLPERRLLELLEDAVDRGLIEPIVGYVRPTPLGGRFLDDLLASLF